MKDYFGKEISVGDKVLFPLHDVLYEGTIDKVYGNGYTIKFQSYEGERTTGRNDDGKNTILL